jgi:hypothetical protein
MVRAMNKPHLLAAVLALSLSALAPSLARAADTVGDCHVGAYRLADGRVVDIGPLPPDKLRWRQFDGASGALAAAGDGAWTSTLGWTGQPDGKTVRFGDCAAGSIDFDRVAGTKIPLESQDTTFAGAGGVRLAGRLVMPPGKARAPIVVLIHGSERYSGRDLYPLQRLLPAEGVGVFVYDKRGTGHSDGRYTQDFSLLADDAVAALAEAKRLAGPRAGRAGFEGGSQGGWVAPLAASRSRPDFVIVGFGLAVNALEEDREEVALDMRLKGHGPGEIAKALELQSAAAEVVASRFTAGYARLDAVRAKYKDEPWYKDVGGDFTAELLPLSEAQIKARAPAMEVGTPWRYEPMPVLRSLEAPQLWILGADDVDAPSAETARRLRGLAAAGRPVTLAMYPDAGHGIYEYVTDAKGQRQSTRNADGFFRMIRDFARDGRLHGRYGRSTISGPAAP